MHRACSSARAATRPTIRAKRATSLPGRRNWKKRKFDMAAAEITAPPLKPYPVIPILEVGAMAKSKPYVANAQMQQALGFPGELVEGWQGKAIARLGELLGKYRSLKVYLDACVHCGACTD